MAKCLVTGGAGFIGSNLVDKLVDEGHEVLVIDNESATAHDRFYYNANVKYYKYDIKDYYNTRPLYNDIEYVFHLAAESRIQPCVENPIMAVETNTLGTAMVLQCSREAGVRRVIYSSTSSAYGLANTPPLREDMVEDCLNPYSVSKVAGEKLCKMYTDLFGLETITFRYFNVYGPRQPLKGQYAPVIGLFLKQRHDGRPLTVVGDGSQRRDFTHVNDVVEANLVCMKSGVPGEMYNVGTGVNISVKELAHMISNEIQFIPARPGEAKISLADNRKLLSLGWDPTVKLEDYIKEQLNG